MSKAKILIVDDDLDILEFLSYNLKNEGYDVKTESNSTLANSKAITYNPDLVILDVMMPNMDGVELCEELRKSESLRDILIVFLTARAEDYSQIAGYEAGADDYISKPIKPKVLSSKIKALLKRKNRSILNENNNTSDSPKLIKNLSIDRERYIVTKDEQDYILPKKEFELLYLLASQPEKVFLRDDIYNSVWGDSFVGDRTIDVHIRKLRKKFGDNIIQTLKGVGYKFSD